MTDDPLSPVSDDINLLSREDGIPAPADILFDPEQFAAHFLYILDKNKNKTLFHYNYAQRHFMQNRTGHDLILKARQLGFSTAIQGELFHRAITRTTTAMVMSHNDASTQKLRRIQERFWENCRIGDMQPARKYSNATLVTYPDYDSTVIIATAGSTESGRGDTYTDFHGSECAFWVDAERILAGAIQAGNPDVVLESTPNGSTGWFYERCVESLSDKFSPWKLHFYPWFFDPSYATPLEKGETLEYDDEEQILIDQYHLTAAQIKWRRDKKKVLKRLFIQEYPENPESCFLVSGESYFGNVSNNFNAPYGATYDPTHKYAAGLDWGRENDFTDLFIIDVTRNVQVDLLHLNKLPWGVIRKRVADRCTAWSVKTVVAESNSIGAVNIEELKKLGIRVHPFTTANKSKADLMMDLYEALHEQNLQLLPHAETRHQFESFVSTKLISGTWRIAAAGKGHDDIIIAAGLAHFARKYARVQIWA